MRWVFPYFHWGAEVTGGMSCTQKCAARRLGQEPVGREFGRVRIGAESAWRVRYFFALGGQFICAREFLVGRLSIFKIPAQEPT